MAIASQARGNWDGHGPVPGPIAMTIGNLTIGGASALYRDLMEGLERGVTVIDFSSAGRMDGSGAQLLAAAAAEARRRGMEIEFVHGGEEKRWLERAGLELPGRAAECGVAGNRGRR